MLSIDIPSLATRYSLPLCARSVRLAHALFFGTFLCQVLNTALRHGNRESGYWVYILLLEGPVMLLNLFGIFWVQQWLAKKRELVTDSEFQPSVLWSYGSLTMPSTENISQDIQLALVVPLVSFGLMLFWVLIYVLLEDDDVLFDKTFWDGVDETELNSLDGILDNIAAQSVWRCFTLGVMGFILPAYPMTAAALWAGVLVRWSKFTHQKIALITDVAGTTMASILLLVGIFETFWDDDNGVGIWHFFNSAVLLLFTVPRMLASFKEDTDASGHVLMGRPCYQEQEECETTTTTTNTAGTVPPSKEQEMSNTTGTQNEDATGSNSDGEDGEMVTEIV